MKILTNDSSLGKGDEREQLRFLDNFWMEVDLLGSDEKDVAGFLYSVIFESSNSYLKRSAFIILGQLTISKAITNQFIFISTLKELILQSDPLLKVIALRYAPYFQELNTVDFIEHVKQFSDDPNGDIASEAFICLGMFNLTKDEAPLSREELILMLRNASNDFHAASLSSENRDDAEFYFSLIDWCLDIAKEKTFSNERYKELYQKLNIYKLYSYLENAWQLHFFAFEMIHKIQEGIDVAKVSNRWINIPFEIKALMDVRLGISTLLSNSNSGKVSDILFDRVLKPIQNVAYQATLYREKERLIAAKESSDENDLVRFIEELLKSFPDESSPKPNLNLLAALVQNLGQKSGVEQYNKIQNKIVSPEVLAALTSMTPQFLPLRTGSRIGEEILARIEIWVDEMLPSYDSLKKAIFLNVVEEIIRYTIATITGYDKKRFLFLFAKSEGGLGEEAIERDLQDDMFAYFQHSKIADGLDHEKSKFVDGGRVDIVYRKDIITIPIELKRALKQHTFESLESDYIAQAQTYTAGHDQLGIFAVLELSDKSSQPPPNIRDWFKFHHLIPSTGMSLNSPDYIVSVIIPGNRRSPSARSKY